MRLEARSRNLKAVDCYCAVSAYSKDQPGNGPKPDAGDAQMTSDVQLVDGYLEKWDRFAQGENQLVPDLRENKVTFEAALAWLLRAGDKRAPARMVFYSVVQVGGSRRRVSSFSASRSIRVCLRNWSSNWARALACAVALSIASARRRSGSSFVISALTCFR